MQTILFSQKELLPVYLENNQKVRKDVTKIDDYERGKRPKQVSLETCLIGLRKRKQKLEQRIETYAKHIKNKTLPPIIFGGRKNFYERMKTRYPIKNGKIYVQGNYILAEIKVKREFEHAHYS